VVKNGKSDHTDSLPFLVFQQDILILMFFPIKFLTTINKLDEPFNLELVSVTSLRFHNGIIVVMGSTSKGLGRKVFSNSFTFSPIIVLYLVDGII
jgi:hypothetical protein